MELWDKTYFIQGTFHTVTPEQIKNWEKRILYKESIIKIDSLENLIRNESISSLCMAKIKLSLVNSKL